MMVRKLTQLDLAVAAVMATEKPLSAKETAAIVGCSERAVADIRHRLCAEGRFQLVSGGGPGRGRKPTYKEIIS